MAVARAIYQKIKQILGPVEPPAGSVVNIKGYHVDLFQKIGRGGFGEVYRGVHPDGRSVAAKCLSSGQNKRASTLRTEIVSFFKLPKDHDNIVKIYDIKYSTESNDTWIMMELCTYGDLDNYFDGHRDYVQNLDVKVDLMIQTMNGLSYLHGKDIVHRDIKPANILIQKKNNGDPLVRLGDFGLSKFLDPNDETSRMSSNVGTFFFKAPEFWSGEIEYHRNVDIFSAGLTFLCMVQYTPGRPLNPTIERSLDVPAENGIPVGLVMRQRQIAIPSQTAVTLVRFTGEDDIQTIVIKELIERMTSLNAASRPSSSTVLEKLQHLVPEKVTVTKCHTLTEAVTNMYVPKNEDYMVIRKVQKLIGPMSVRAFLQIVNKTGDVVEEMEDICTHISPCLAELRHTGRNIYVAHACVQCGIIQVYNMNQKSSYDAFSWGVKKIDDVIRQYITGDFLICTGPVGTLFASCGTNAQVVQLKWQESSSQLVQSRKLPKGVSSGRSMCYVEQSDALIIARSDGSVTAFRSTTGKRLWQLPNVFLGRRINTRCMSSYSTGSLYLMDGKPDDQPRLLIINSSTGNVRQVTDDITIEEDHGIQGIGCCQTSPNLLVYYQYHNPTSPGGNNIARHKIMCYDISMEDMD